MEAKNKAWDIACIITQCLDIPNKAEISEGLYEELRKRKTLRLKTEINRMMSYLVSELMKAIEHEDYDYIYRIANSLKQLNNKKNE